MATSQRNNSLIATAEHRGEWWSLDEDLRILEERTGSDYDLAVAMGRTVASIHIRRSRLKKVLREGWTLAEFKRSENERRMTYNNKPKNHEREMAEFKANVCDVCFCFPHMNGCNNE